MQFDFSKVLTRAGQIIWKFKVLWIFGILASCGRGGGSGGSSNFSSGNNTGGQDPFSGQPPEFPPFLEGTPPENFLITFLLIFFAILCFVLVLSLIFFALRMVGRLGLIQGTLYAEAGAESLSFMQLFEAGKPYFLRILLLNFLIGVAGFVIALVIFLPVGLLIFFTFGLALLCLIPLLLLAIPVALFIQAIVEQANVALVVEDLDAIAAIQRGWKIVRNNWAPPIILSVILFFARFFVGLIVAIPVLLAMGPLFAGIIGGGITENLNLIYGGTAIFVLCLCALFPFLLAIGGIIESYVGSAWTLTYIQLTDHEPSLPELEAGTA
ncbi:MAG: hypothetical protein DWQ07_24835 [Chloroflexi bacterium]|nr:MAG: hypothetical protein DWQ07_24835 [Chloroflexota bacterium]MBL1197081.1 hypothetical protein [Chloroflexota bacterium]NOH14376.1 hypothetical protein [Chloroflexota bacterium]